MSIRYRTQINILCVKLTVGHDAQYQWTWRGPDGRDAELVTTSCRNAPEARYGPVLFAR
jgi:hypothetical protein